MKRLKNILLLWFASLLAVGCDLTIHEYPDGEIAPSVVSFTLNMEFDTEMPLHATVDHKSRAMLALEPDLFDVRYIINVYRDLDARQESRDIIKQLVISKDDVYSLNHSVDLQLDEGNYRFIIWADYVDAGTTDHKYYNCDDFANISLIPGEDNFISGSNDWRDAFVGRQTAEIRITSEENVVTVPMARPMAKYRFISTDLEEFITKMMALKAKAEAERREQEAAARGEDETKAEDETKSDDDTKVDTKLEINLEDYYVVFYYPGWVNTAYNAYIDKSAWSSQGIRFRSSIDKLTTSEAEIGFDYVIVNSAEDTSKDLVSEVEVSLEIYQKAEREGEPDIKVGGVSKFFVPLVRSRLTEVRGKFLSSQADGAVGIIPGFDGEFTIPID